MAMAIYEQQRKTERMSDKCLDRVSYLAEFQFEMLKMNKRNAFNECNVIRNDYGTVLTATSITPEPVLSIYVCEEKAKRRRRKNTSV